MRTIVSAVVMACLLYARCEAFCPPTPLQAASTGFIKGVAPSRRIIQHDSFSAPVSSSLASPWNAPTQPTSTTLQLSASEIIEAGVSIDTFAPQFLWLLIIAAPDSKITKQVMEPITPILLLALVHFIIVAVAASQDGALDQVLLFQDVFTPELSQLQGMRKMFEIENFVAEEWPHVLIWDLFVGRSIWKDGLARDINTRVSLTFCNIIGPPGLLIHAAICLVTGKGLPKV